MERQQLESLRQRYAAGEKVTALATEAGIPWQRLWGLLKQGGGQQQPPKQEQQQHGRRFKRTRRLKNRQHRNEGAQTPRDPVTRCADGIDRITFNSVGEAIIDAMADYAQNEGNRTFVAGRLAYHMTGSDAWANHFTKEKLLDTIQNPPAHLRSAVEEMRKSLMAEVCPPVCSRRRLRRNQEWGDELNAEQVLTRCLTPWERMAREHQPKRTVTVGVNLTVGSAQRSQHLLYRGAAAAALADILTSRGMSVEVVAYWTIGNMSSGSNRVVARYVVKRADMPLNIGSLSVALAEIAYARLVCLYGLARHMPGVMDDSLGFCGSLPAADRSGIDYYADETICDRGQAVAWLTKAAQRQESEVLHV